VYSETPISQMAATMKLRLVFVALFALGISACSSDDGTTGPNDDDFDFTGDLIAFVSDRDGQSEIYLIQSDGSELINITTHNSWDSEPAWSPDGTKIAFASDRGGSDDIYVMNVDGSGVVRLTTNAAADTHPAWCSGGTKIAFRSNRDGNSEIYIMDPDGSNQTRLTNDPGADLEPVCATGRSADALACTKIAFFSDRDGDGEVWIMETDGTALMNLTNNDDFDCSPAMASQCLQYSIVTDRGGGSNDIYLIDFDGTNVTPLVTGPGDEFQSSMSPDGSRVVYDTDQNGNWDIYIVNTSGTGTNRLTIHSADDELPVWRP